MPPIFGLSSNETQSSVDKRTCVRKDLRSNQGSCGVPPTGSCRRRARWACKQRVSEWMNSWKGGTCFLATAVGSVEQRSMWQNDKHTKVPHCNHFDIYAYQAKRWVDFGSVLAHIPSNVAFLMMSKYIGSDCIHFMPVWFSFRFKCKWNKYKFKSVPFRVVFVMDEHFFFYFPLLLAKLSNWKLQRSS